LEGVWGFFKERTGPDLEGVKADSWKECKVPKGEGRREKGGGRSERTALSLS